MKTSLGFLIGCCVGGLSGMSQSTESPSVVPVGAFWIESDGLNYAQDGPGTKQLNVAATLFTWGVVENLDVQLEWAGWTRSTAITPTGERETVSGWGDMGIRTKWNFSGDETNESAWAILTSLKIPAASTAAGGNGEWEPGMSLIYGQPLSDGGGGVEAMVAINALANGTTGHDAAWFSSVVYGHSSGWYGEILADYEPAATPNVVSLSAGVGFAYQVAPSLALDFEILAGLNAAATDLMAVFRVTWTWDPPAAGYLSRETLR